MQSIPHHRTRTIPRLRLLRSLQTWQDLRLVRIIAPAGYGKSTLAAAWARSLAALPDEPQPTVTWLSLFEDLDAERYLRALIEALLPTLPSLHAVHALDGSKEYSLAQRASMLCAELNAAPQPIVLVVDDYHLLTRPDAHEITQQILDGSGHRCLLVLLSRTTPPVRLDQLILDDAVLTLTEQDLAFDHEEFLAFAGLSGIDAYPASILDDLERRCSGWVTGLKLLSYDLLHPSPADVRTRLALLDSPDAEHAVQHFLESRVLVRLPDDLRHFALAAAQLPWMSADLLAAASAMPVSLCVQRLADLAAAVGFIGEFESAGELRFRFHPLVHDALRRLAAAHPPGRFSLSRAAAWLCDHDCVDEALALMERDDGRPTTDDGELPSSVVRRPSSAAPTLCSDSLLLPAVSGLPSAVDFLDSLARAVRRGLLRYDVTAVQRWLAALPTALVAECAALAVASAWAAYFAESIQQLDESVERARAALHASPAVPVTDELHFELVILDAYVHMLHGRMTEAAHALVRAEAMPRAEHSFGVGYLHFFRAVLPHDPSDLDARIRSLQIGADIFERIGHSYGVVIALYSQVLIKQRYGDLLGALASSDFLQTFAARRNRSRHIYVRSNLVTRGELLYMLDRVPEARNAMQHVLTASENDDTQIANVFIARTYLALCDAAESTEPSQVLRSYDEANESIDDAHWARILELDFDAIHGLIAWPRLLRQYRAGHPERCRQTVESLGFAPADVPENAHDTLRMAILSGAVLGLHEPPHLSAQLDAFLEHLEASRFRYMAMHVRLLCALLAQRRDDDATALEHVRLLLPLIEHTGMRRLILDFPVLLPLVQKNGGPFARTLLPHFPSSTSGAKPTPLDFGLTDQEKRILTQISRGRSAKEIAAAHTLSHKTIYSHIYRIYRKLGVTSRAEAVRVAQEMGIGDRG